MIAAAAGRRLVAAGPSNTTFTAPAAVPAWAIDSAAVYSSRGKRWVTTPSTGKARVAQPLADRPEGSLAVRFAPVRGGAAHGELACPDQRPLDLVTAGAAAEHERAPGAQQAHGEVDAQR